MTQFQGTLAPVEHMSSKRMLLQKYCKVHNVSTRSRHVNGKTSLPAHAGSCQERVNPAQGWGEGRKGVEQGGRRQKREVTGARVGRYLPYWALLLLGPGGGLIVGSNGCHIQTPESNGLHEFLAQIKWTSASIIPGAGSNGPVSTTVAYVFWQLLGGPLSRYPACRWGMWG